MPLFASLLLAQADAPPPEIVSWLAVAMYLILSAGGVVALLGGVKYLREKKEETPSPLVVKAHDEWATKAQLTEVHGRIKRERAEIDAHFARVEAAAAEAARRIDGELHLIREEIQESREAGEARVEKLRDAMGEQTKLIISVIREGKA